MISTASSQQAVKRWFDALEPLPINGGLPARGAVAAGLVILQRLQTSFDLAVNRHLAKGGTQIAGLSIVAVQQILQRYGEPRPRFSRLVGILRRAESRGIIRVSPRGVSLKLSAVARNLQ